MMFEMLSDALDHAEKSLAAEKIVLKESFRTRFERGINYGEKEESHTEIDTLKGKKTKKYFHVIISRLDSGRYELICYAS